MRAVQDFKNSAQRQCFTYDALDRLTRGMTTNDAACALANLSIGNGAYDKTTTYDDARGGRTGNLGSKAGLVYSYEASTQPHAVRRVNGAEGTTQTITVRAKGVIYNGVWPQMSVRVNGTSLPAQTVNTTAYANYTFSATLTGNDVIEVVYSNDQAARGLYVDNVVVGGATVQAEGGAMVYDRAISGTAFDGRDVIAGQEGMFWNGALQFARGRAVAAGYDENGSMTSRVVEGSGYLLVYDGDNRLVQVKRGSATAAAFVYDGDGKRVKATFGATTYAYVGNHYEKETTGATVRYRKYYYADGVRVAMRDGTTPLLILTDHPSARSGQALGSTAVMADLTTGARTGEVWYRPWGEYRGTPFGSMPTAWRFTGQREDATIGLYYFNARYLDPQLGRFTQADTIVPDPGDPQALNRYSYVLNNPLRYTDPTGHCIPDLCPGVPQVEHPGQSTDLQGEAYAQWLLNYILWIDRERATTGGSARYTSNASQVSAATELNAFLMEDPEVLGELFYQELMMSAPQAAGAAASIGSSMLASSGGHVLGVVRNAGSNLLQAPRGSNPWSSSDSIESTVVGPEGMTVYRAHADGRASGSWVTQEPVPNQRFVRESLAVRPEWNPATYVSEIWLPPGTRIQTGVAGSQGSGYPGGAAQIQVLNPSDIVRQVVIRTWRLSP